MIFTNYYLEKLPKNQLIDLAEFIVTENFKHHSNNKLTENYKNDVNSIFEEEFNFYENSEVFATKDQAGNILGAIRLLKWNYTDVLPLQKIFGINPLIAFSQPNTNDIFHVGRFAVKKDVHNINLFKKLLVCIAKIICNNMGNVAFAECDSKLLRVLKLFGIKALEIGNSVNYLGSETIPIVMTCEGIIDFYNSNKHLLENRMNKIPDFHALPKKETLIPIANSA